MADTAPSQPPADTEPFPTQPPADPEPFPTQPPADTTPSPTQPPADTTPSPTQPPADTTPSPTQPSAGIPSPTDPSIKGGTGSAFGPNISPGAAGAIVIFSIVLAVLIATGFVFVKRRNAGVGLVETHKVAQEADMEGGMRTSSEPLVVEKRQEVPKNRLRV
ncbi:hypothetical protein HDV00_004994 [Rhizophlyctis rosea]|nr:hypothetical protein HDV00_004994 [Rhizophlyctis rosea]